MRAGDNGGCRELGHVVVLVEEEVLQSGLSSSMSPVCPLPEVVCIRRSLQGEGDKQNEASPVRECRQQLKMSGVTGIEVTQSFKQ